MEKKRDIKVFIEQLTKPRVEALFSELFDEYANKGVDKKQFAVKLLTGELEGIMDDYVDAFMGKTALTITDMDTNQLNSKVISKVKLTYFSVEDLSYFISDIVEAIKRCSEDDKLHNQRKILLHRKESIQQPERLHGTGRSAWGDTQKSRQGGEAPVLKGQREKGDHRLFPRRNRSYRDRSKTHIQQRHSRLQIRIPHNSYPEHGNERGRAALSEMGRR